MNLVIENINKIYFDSLKITESEITGPCAIREEIGEEVSTLMGNWSFRCHSKVKQVVDA